MNPSRKEAVIAAFETGDQLAIRRLGWWPAWEACSTWWAPRQTCTAMEFVPFAKLLGDEDPEKVLDALRDLCGDWRPTPAQVRGHLHRKTGDESRVDVGRGRDRAGSEEALRAVADAIRTGEQPCSCGRHSPQWRRDDAWVLRCPDCGGLEHGQVYSLEDSEAA
jgi:hypothetical protein